MAATKSIADRFWAKVEVRGPNDCWIWKASRRTIGYGQFFIENIGPRKVKLDLAHRVAWRFTHGEIPEGLFVLHHCDNPPCVNVAHLFLGTQADNRSDCVSKGRQPKGERHYAKLHPDKISRGEAHSQARLTEADVRSIRLDSASADHLAQRYGVIARTIRKIRKRTRWAHIL